MKRITMMISILIFGLVLSNHADEVTRSFPEEKVTEFEKQILMISTPRHSQIGDVHRGPTPAEFLHNFVKQSSIPKEVYIATVKKVAEDLIADTFVYTNYLGKAVLGIRKGSTASMLINIMGSLGDFEFLPWLELQATGSQWSDVRTRAAVNYVKIAGLDAVTFVRKILTGSREKYDLNCKYLVIKELSDQLARAETAKASQEKMDAAYEMLIEHAQYATHVSEVTPIDKMLCQQVPSYQSSIQRERILSRFVNSTNETVRGNYTRKFNELQKTPKAERIDLSTRFLGLAVPEVLKDSSKEASDSDEETSEDK